MSLSELIGFYTNCSHILENESLELPVIPPKVCSCVCYFLAVSECAYTCTCTFTYGFLVHLHTLVDVYIYICITISPGRCDPADVVPSNV